MKLSKGNFITVRDRITSESLSQQILLQSGQLKRFGAGIYAKNNFIVKVQSNVENIIREVMEKYDSVEVSMPLLQPKSLWESSGRWEGYNTSGQMFHCDMNNGIYCMAPTAEEAVVEFVKSSIKSYKDLPINIYQIGTKFRNELRARGGLFRSKEFTMMDAYSFHASSESLNEEYLKMRQAYFEIFSRLGLKVIPVKALNGEMGGNYSEEFMCLSDCGEDIILVNEDHSLAFNTEILELENAEEYLLKNYNIKDLSSFHQESCIELGHIFQLGQKYSSSMEGLFVDCQNSLIPYFMGCYGIGVSRVVATICSNNCDESGLRWPLNIAPYHVYIVYTERQGQNATNLYNTLIENGIKTILDDRKVSFGAKIKDAKLFGIPYLIIIGNSYNDDNIFEVENRLNGEKFLIRLEQLIATFK